MSELVLEVRNLSLAYGATLAVKSISFEAFEDEILAIVGPNGAGKSTLLEAVAGLHMAREGSIAFKGRSLTGTSVFRRRLMGIVLVPQDENIFPGMTVRENLEMGAFRTRRGNVKQKLQYVFDLFPRLKERERQMANTLSGGERRMLAIGMGVTGEAQLYLIDEPSVGLAPRIVTKVLESLKTLQRDTARPIVVAEQNTKVLHVAQRLLGMEAGERRFFKSVGSLSQERLKELYLGLCEREREA
ncbi:ATP-binding cassette domain-containing protein [Candidatus Bipolaricaulota bacterium]|nr:ATP-binding cassette domain-containing protein [Candidatus Bipolaricaulota bacterium]